MQPRKNISNQSRDEKSNLDLDGKLVLMYLENGVQLVGRVEELEEEGMILTDAVEIREIITPKGPALSGRLLGTMISGDLRSTLILLDNKAEQRALYSQIVSNIQLA